MRGACEGFWGGGYSLDEKGLLVAPVTTQAIMSLRGRHHLGLSVSKPSPSEDPAFAL